MDEIQPEHIYLKQQYHQSSRVTDPLNSSRQNSSRLNKNSSTDIDMSRHAVSKLDSSFKKEKLENLLKNEKPLEARLKYN